MSLWTDRIANASKEDYGRLLYDATVTAQPEHILTLLAKGAMIVPIDEKQNTALHVAAKMGWHLKLEALTSSVADIDVENAKGRTALWYAAVKGHSKCVAILLNHPLKPKRLLDELLTEVVDRKLNVVVDYLLSYLIRERGWEQSKEYGRLMLAAVVNKDKKMIKTFKNRGFSINGGMMEKDGSIQYVNSPDLGSQSYHSNPILEAIRNKDLDMVEYLYSWIGARINIPIIVSLPNKEKVDIVHFSRMYGTPEITQFLEDFLPLN